MGRKKITVENGSQKWKLNKTDFWKIVKGLLIGMGGAALTWLSIALGNFDFGSLSFAIVAVFGALINFILKLLKDNSK